MSIAAISGDETVSFDEFDSRDRRDRVASSTLRNAICTEENQFRTCNKSVTLELPENSWKVEMVSKKARNGNEDRRFETDVKTGIRGHWGGEDGFQVEGYLQGKVYSKDGAYVKGNVSRYSDGTGDFDASAGYEGKVGSEK